MLSLIQSSATILAVSGKKAGYTWQNMLFAKRHAFLFPARLIPALGDVCGVSFLRPPSSKGFGLLIGGGGWSICNGERCSWAWNVAQPHT